MSLYYLITHNDYLIAIETTKEAVAAYPNSNYVHWDTELCGACPPLAKMTNPEPFADTRTYDVKRACAYKMEVDPLYIAYRARVEIDGDSEATAKQPWLNARTAIKLKYPKPE